MKFILSTDQVNKYGFRVMTEGIEISDFEKNPVMHYNHNRGNLPIGKWTNIRKEEGKLVADAEFDVNDPLAVQVKQKVEAGILNATSIGFDVLEISEDKKHLVQGQTRGTVTRASIMEASIVDIPANPGALKMNFPQQGVSLSGAVPDVVLNTILPTIKSQLNMSKIAVKLGLAAEATEEQIVAALEARDKQAEEKLTAGLLSYGKSIGAVTEKNEGLVKKLAAADFDAALEYINSLKAEAPAPENKGKSESIAEALKAVSGGQAGNVDDRSSWNLTDWRKKDPQGLEELRTSKPDEFEKLLKTLNKVTK